MAKVQLTAAAVADLDRLIRTHSLPADTKRRVKRSLVPLRRFPRLGAELTGRWRDFRFVFGPWRWMLIVYILLEDAGRVVVVTIQDARSSIAATAERSSSSSGSATRLQLSRISVERATSRVVDGHEALGSLAA